VLIADDHSLVREGISALLRCYDDVEVVGEASDGKETVQKTLKLRPHVVLMDIVMPGLGGIEAAAEIKRQAPEVKVLILSQYDDQEYVRRVLKKGVSGYILKHALAEELIGAIRAVSRGGVYLYPTVASHVLENYLHTEESPDDPYEQLTDREKQVLKLLAEGLSHKEIAQALDISVKTVIAHQGHIMEKLNLTGRVELVKFAIRRKIIPLEDGPSG